MQDLISRQAAIDIVEFECGEWSGLAKTIVKAFEQLPSAHPEKRTEKRMETHACDCISRQAAIDILDAFQVKVENGEEFSYSWARMRMTELPSAQPERKKMSNKEWVDFLSEQFTVSRTSAREMLHGLMRWKAEDNFKKQFSGGRNESRRR